MTPCEIGKIFEEQAKEVLEREGYKIKQWFSKENWTAPCDMLVEKEGEEMYCEVRGVTGRLSSITFSTQKMANLEALNEHKPVILFLVRRGKHKIVRLEDLPKERYVAYPKKKEASNYYRVLEKFINIRNKVKKREFKVVVTDEELKMIREEKKNLSVETNHELIFLLIDHYYKTKGGAIL